MKNKKRHSLFKIFSLFGALIIPAVVAAACGTPQSNKYIESVAQFNGLKLDPNKADSETVNLSYSQLLKEGATPQASWKYNTDTALNDFKTPSSDEITKLSSTYGIVANSLAYLIARPAAVFATSAVNYNNALPEKDNDPNAIHLFQKLTPADPATADANIVKEFYEANANNLLIGNRDNNIGFGITDISFKFSLLPSMPTTSTAPSPSATNPSPTPPTDPRQDIAWNSSSPLFPLESDIAKDNINNRLTKMWEITDIHIYFRFFIAGTEGSGQPTRDSIIAPNNPDYASRVDILKEQWKNNFSGENLSTYAFDLQMQDMAAQLSFSASEKKDDSGKITGYTIEPGSITSIAPLALYNQDNIGISNKKPNSLKMNNSLFNTLIDYSKIMSNENGDDSWNSYTSQQEKLRNLTNLFLNEVNQTKPVVTGLKNQVIGNNELKLTIEDYFNLYFKGLANADTKDIFGKASS